MAISKSISSQSNQNSVAKGEQLLPLWRDSLRHLSDGIDRFLAWEREHILLRDPSPKEQQEHRLALTWFLRIVRVLHATIADPEFPDSRMRGILQAQLWRLEESWKRTYEPMPEGEADHLLREVFPDEPSA